MSFSDEDLKTLRMACEYEPDGKVGGHATQFLALLARLEAEIEERKFRWGKMRERISELEASIENLVSAGDDLWNVDQTEEVSKAWRDAKQSALDGGKA